MFTLKKIKKEFNLNGFVILRQVFSKKEIGKIINEIEKSNEIEKQNQN